MITIWLQKGSKATLVVVLVVVVPNISFAEYWALIRSMKSLPEPGMRRDSGDKVERVRRQVGSRRENVVMHHTSIGGPTSNIGTSRLLGCLRSSWRYYH